MKSGSVVERNRSSSRNSVLAVVGLILLAQSGIAEPPATANTREAMQEIFAQLQILLPAAVKGELGVVERNREIADALDRMQARIDALSKHGDAFDPGARLFGRALSRDVRRARDFFNQGRFDSAAFTIESMVDDCMACHTRRKADDSLITRGFVSTRALKDLDPLQLAAIAVATRGFDEAMQLYERAFREPDIVPEVYLGPIAHYLKVTLRVARSPARARKTIDYITGLDELSEAVREDLEHWKRTLAVLSPNDFAGTTLDRVRKTMARADAVSRYPSDQRALIEYLAASSQLHDLVALPQESPADAAEIYELLGNAELGVSQSSWLSRADLYWETAIRLAPDSPAAPRAYASLVNETRAGYTGSGGLRLPAEEAARLDELRSLVEGEKRGVIEGAALFSVHCAVCHGRKADGRGAIESQLMWVPADLTRIAARRDGQFPEAEVFELIARRDPLANHQSPEMPRWGKYWKDDSRIDSLVNFLRTLQRP